MVGHALGMRINPDASRSVKDQVREAARLGAKGLVLDAAGDLAPDRLSDTGRRELKHLFRSVETPLIALHLPTRRPFDTDDQLEVRLARADGAFALAFELGARLVLARVGVVPAVEPPSKRPTFTHALTELARRADHRGVRLAIETEGGPPPALREFLDALNHPGLAASVDPAALLRAGIDPPVAVVALGPHVVHAYANDASNPSNAPRIANPRGSGYPSGVLDWAEYVGALEEIGYRGPLTIWPDPAFDAATQFTAMVARLNRL